jgi:hypothetical protein
LTSVFNFKVVSHSKKVTKKICRLTHSPSQEHLSNPQKMARSLLKGSTSPSMQERVHGNWAISF